MSSPWKEPMGVGIFTEHGIFLTMTTTSQSATGAPLLLLDLIAPDAHQERQLDEVFERKHFCADGR